MTKNTKYLFLAWVMFWIGLSLTLSAAFQVKKNIESDDLREFSFDCGQISLKIQERLNSFALILRGGTALFDASKQVTRQEWHAYIETLRAQDSIPGVQGIGFAELITPDQLSSHTARIRSEGFPEYNVWPAGNRNIYSSIIYLEPFRDRNLRAFGYDMFSEPVRRAAMEQARDTGQATLTGKVLLIQETSEEIQAGTLMYVPVYRQNMSHDTVEQRRQALLGWVYSPYRMNDLISEILGSWQRNESQSIGLRIYDGSQIAPTNILFASKSVKDFSTPLLVQQQRIIDFNGRQWLLIFDSVKPSLFDTRFILVWITLVGGIALSGLLFGLIRSVINTQNNATRIANKLTEEIRLREKLLTENEYRWRTALEGAGDGVWDWNLENDTVFFSNRWKKMLGFSEGEIGDGLNEWEKRIHPEDKANTKASLHAYFDGLAPIYRNEHRVLCKNGSWRWVLDRGVVVSRNDDGKPLRMIGTHVDMTERKKMEESLSFRQFSLDHAGEEIFWLDQNARILDANETACHKLGYTLEELRTLTVAEIDPFYPIDKWGEHWHELSLNKILRFESVHKSRDGNLFPVEIVANYFVYEGQAFNCALAHDITDRKQAEEALKALQSRLAFLINYTPAVICSRSASSDYEITFVSDNLTAQLGYCPEEVIGIKGFWINHIHPDERSNVIANLVKVFEEGSHKHEYRFLHKDGNYRWLYDELVLIRDTEGNPLELVGYWSDITSRKRAEEELRIAAATFETHEAIMITDAKANILRVNHAFETITGFHADEVIGKSPRILSSGKHDKKFYQSMWHQLLKTGFWEGEIWDRRKSGQIYPKWLTITALKDPQDTITEYVAIFTDISERKQAEEEIRNLAFYDPLTKLPNRRLMTDRLNLALALSERLKQYGAILFLDMDKFKWLNDTMGHCIGDQMLIEVAERIKASVREIDTIARFGGDEFVVILENLGEEIEESSQRAAVIAEKIRVNLAEPFHFDQHAHISTPSIGVCLFYGHNESTDELIKRADIAMYQAKNAGRNQVHFFDPILQHAVEAHAALEADLRRAISKQQLQLYYQIQYEGNQPFGAEALIRWIHPEHGVISPAQFIPIAEESALIHEIGLWVIETVCQQLAVWSKNEASKNLLIAINVSAHQFISPNFVESIQRMTRKYDVDPSKLKLELTESVILHNIDDVIIKMNALKALGIRLSLDDFGTGYSSLSYLKNLPIDQIKIDQSFVRDIVTDINDAIMVKNIIDIGKNFELNVIAEGVETEEQLNFS